MAAGKPSASKGKFQSVLAGGSGKQPEVCRVFAFEKEAPSSLWLQSPEAFWRHEAVSDLVLLWRSETQILSLGSHRHSLHWLGDWLFCDCRGPLYGRGWRTEATILESQEVVGALTLRL